MPFLSALTNEPDTRKALAEVTASVAALGRADLALLFYSVHHAETLGKLAAVAHEQINARCLLGCPGETVIGENREIEEGPALSLWAARWGDNVTLTPFHLTFEQTSEGPSVLGWPDALSAVDAKQAFLLLLGDPFTFPVDVFLRQINDAQPGLRVMGGMASGGRSPGQNPMLFSGGCLEQGAVGVLVQGPLRVRSVVSQGCRPIGRHMVVTRARDNIILGLGGKPPLLQLQELWSELDPRDQELVRAGLHIGRVLSEYQESFQRGDFLVRNVIGLDRESGAMAVTDQVRVGQTVQFHVRDAATADEDLRELLASEMKKSKPPAAALLFSCNGRGTRLFDAPHHDARAVRAAAGNVPLAGFFAMGEIGPVGGQNFIHGFTASVVLFDEP
jgi:small ligand-binding sensory domain FIST